MKMEKLMVTQTISKFNLSSYLAFRYVVRKNSAWTIGVCPEYPEPSGSQQVSVSSPEEILSTLKYLLKQKDSIKTHETAVFLSGGIDSAIIAALLPKGTKAYTINFIAKSGANEVEYAKKYSDYYSLEHSVVDIYWEDYVQYESLLMTNKKAPLHPVEVALYKAALQAKSDGIKTVVLGNGADSTFGGLDKLLSKDWTFKEFAGRYQFILPEDVLVDPHDITEVFKPYKRGEYIDYINFLKEVHGIGVIQAFNNGIHSAGLKIIEPFEMMKLDGGLDLQRIRAGEPKYFLVDVFKQLYPEISPPRKVPFSRPMDEWLSTYKGPVSELFKKDIDISIFTGDQKYLLHSLDKFITLIARGLVCQ